MAIAGCKSTPQYIYVQPECSSAMRPVLPVIDAGKLYSALVLPHTLHTQDLSELAPELLNDYDGDKTYHDLVEREKLIVDALIENEAIINKVCSNGK